MRARSLRLPSACITVLLALAATSSAAQPSGARDAAALTLAPVDGGANYYSRFSAGLPANPSYFPIGVWFESVTAQADVDADRAAGLNTYVVLTANSDLGLVQSNGMLAILQSDEFSASQAMQGWFLADEVDMTHGPGAGYDEMQGIADATPHDGRIRYSNFGKGVLFWESDAEAARFVNDYQDIVSADAYFFTDNNICSGTEGGVLLAGGAPLSPAECHRAANYRATVSRVRELVNPAGSKPVWAIVELGHPFSESDWPTIAPAQVRAAVWQSLIGGARGIVYFNHSFGGPDQTQHILRDGTDPGSAYAPIRAIVTATNSEIKSLAPVLNSPTVTSGWSQGPGTTAMVKWSEGVGAGSAAKKPCKSKQKKKKQKKKRKCKKKAKGKKAAKKKHKKKRCKSKRKTKGKSKCAKAGPTAPKGDLYVFAGSAGSSVEGSFSLPCVGDTSAAVVGENRSLPVRGGSFRDDFADGNAIHIYRIDAGPKCAAKSQAAVTQVGPPAASNRGDSSGGGSSHILPIALLALSGLVAGALLLLGIRRVPKGAPRRWST